MNKNNIILLSLFVRCQHQNMPCLSSVAKMAFGTHGCNDGYIQSADTQSIASEPLVSERLP